MKELIAGADGKPMEFETPTIDSPPRFTASQEKEEQRINEEADARAVQGELFPTATKESIEADAYVRNAKIKLMLTVELEGEKPITLPLMVCGVPSDRVQELCILSLKSRKNKRRIEAALDLPEPHDPDFDEVEPAAVGETYQPAPAMAGAMGGVAKFWPNSESNLEITPSEGVTIEMNENASTVMGLDLAHEGAEKGFNREYGTTHFTTAAEDVTNVKPSKKRFGKSGPMKVVHQGEVAEVEESFLPADDNFPDVDDSREML